MTDISRTKHATAFGQHRLEATAPWRLIQDMQTEETSRLPTKGTSFEFVSPIAARRICLV
jgi:hypothetical protein